MRLSVVKNLRPKRYRVSVPAPDKGNIKRNIGEDRKKKVKLQGKCNYMIWTCFYRAKTGVLKSFRCNIKNIIARHKGGHVDKAHN